VSINKLISRRGFLKGLGGATAFGTTVSGMELLGGPSKALAGELKIKYGTEKMTICPYCGVGCGILVYAEDNKVIYVEGDPDNPINEGALCSKGASIGDFTHIMEKGKRVENKLRLKKVLYRAPKSTEWEEKDWQWALKEIARRIKDTRDATFEQKNAQGVTVNRTFAMANFGSAALENEENYLFHKFVRGLGLVSIDHHARL